MSCTRLYVEFTETLMDQGRKKRLLSPPKEWFENMWGHNSLFSITNTKDTKLSLMGDFLSLGTLLRLFKDLSSLNLSHPLVSSSSPDTLLPLYRWLQGHSSSLWRVLIIAVPSNQHILDFLKDYHHRIPPTPVLRRISNSTSAF